MGFFDFLQMLGGLALFLYGMSMLGSGLEKVSGGRLEATLEKMTNNIFKAILTGALVTAAIQSSSATTVIVVGLVNARILKLRQAIGVIMGANIGTTVTAHILRLTDLEANNFFMSILKPVNFTPAFLIVGVLMYMISQKSRRRDLGSILIGFGVLFTGMFNMEAAVRPLRDMPFISELFAKFSNPILGVLVGAIVTAVIQSSSASVGILQALSSTGIITFSSAFPIIMGQNIGTCITPVLASMGAAKNAKRSAFVHVSFNVIGTVLFLVGMYTYQALVGFSFWGTPVGKGEIATFHTIFNVVVTVVLVPFAGMLERLAVFCIRGDGEQDEDEDSAALMLDERFLVSPSLAINRAREAVELMATLSRKNYKRSVSLLREYDQKTYERLREVENTIDKLQSKVENYLIRVTEKTLAESESVALSDVLQIVNEFERIGDHADNICDCAKKMHDENIKLSPAAITEVMVVTQAVDEIVELAVDCYQQNDTELAHTVEPLEEVIDILVETVKLRHMERLKQGKCSIDASFPFVEVLTSLERISDYCSNVGVHVISFHSEHHSLDRHEYLREMHKAKTEDYIEKFNTYDKKYFDRLKEAGREAV